MNDKSEGYYLLTMQFRWDSCSHVGIQCAAASHVYTRNLQTQDQQSTHYFLAKKKNPCPQYNSVRFLTNLIQCSANAPELITSSQTGRLRGATRIASASG